MNSGELHYYLFIITLDRLDGSFNINGDPFGRICVLKKTEDVSLKVFNMIKGINASKTIVKIFHVNADVNLMVENVFQNKHEIMIIANEKVKKKKTIKRCVCKEHCAWIPSIYTC